MDSLRAKRFLTVISFLAIVACGGDEKKGASDSAVAPMSTTSQPPTPGINAGWDKTKNGPVILLSAPGGFTMVVLPELTDSSLSATPTFMLDSLSNMPVDLFSRSGLAASATLLVASQRSNTDGCLSWPVGTLSPSPSKPWSAGFRTGVAVPLKLDSLEGMTSGDSSFVTTEIARVASAVAEGTDPTFRGLPFAVRRAYRFQFGTTSVLIGDVVRKINEEADPRVEHLLLVAERAGDAGSKYVVAFESRVAGAEDVVRTSEVLAAVRFAQGRPTIIATFEYEDGSRLVLLERTSQKEWKITWRSAYAGC